MLDNLLPTEIWLQYQNIYYWTLKLWNILLIFNMSLLRLLLLKKRNTTNKLRNMQHVIFFFKLCLDLNFGCWYLLVLHCFIKAKEFVFTMVLLAEKSKDSVTKKEIFLGSIRWRRRLKGAPPTPHVVLLYWEQLANSQLPWFHAQRSSMKGIPKKIIY